MKHEEGRRKVEQVLSRLHEETRAAKAMQRAAETRLAATAGPAARRGPSVTWTPRGC